MAAAILGLGNADAVVEECHRVTGEWCLLARVRAVSTLALQELIDRIRGVSGVAVTVTSIAMSDLRERCTPCAVPA